MPPHIRFYVRTGNEAGEGQICCWSNGYTDAEGRPPSYHLYAVWPRAVQYERPDDDRNDALRAQSDSQLHRVPDGAQLTEVTIQDIYAALVDDASRNEMIANDIVRAIK